MVFTAYSGTTLENYLTCAVLVDGDIKFDKGKEPRHFHREIYYEHNLTRAVAQSISLAKELKQYPLVIKGLLEPSYRERFYLEPGKCFPVNGVYIPKTALSSSDLTIFWNEFGDPYGYFIELNPFIFWSQKNERY